jgi:Domain of unknown function (DUF4421)
MSGGIEMTQELQKSLAVEDILVPNLSVADAANLPAALRLTIPKNQTRFGVFALERAVSFFVAGSVFIGVIGPLSSSEAAAQALNQKFAPVQSIGRGVKSPTGTFIGHFSGSLPSSFFGSGVGSGVGRAVAINTTEPSRDLAESVARPSRNNPKPAEVGDGSGQDAEAVARPARPVVKKPVESWRSDQGAESEAARSSPENSANLKQTHQAPSVQDYSEDWAGTFVVTTPSYGFTIEPPGGRSLRYVSNTLARNGIGLAYKGTGASFSYGGGSTEESERLRGKSTSLDYSLSIYWKQLGVDIFFQQYRGFYIEGTDGVITPSVSMPGASAAHYGGQLYYVYSPERYTMSSAFDQGLRQTRSGGSFLMSTYLQAFGVSTGNQVIGDINRIGGVFQPQNVVSYNLGIAGGYGYSFRYGSFYLSGQLLVGYGLQTKKFELASGNSESNGFGSKITFHFGLGWNWGRNSLGVALLSDAISVSAVNQVSTSSNNGRLFYTYHFDI